MSKRASQHEIRRTIDAYGSAFLYDGVLLDPTRVVAHLDSAPNRWAAFTDDEVIWFEDALNAAMRLCIEKGVPYEVPDVYRELRDELDRRFGSEIRARAAQRTEPA